MPELARLSATFTVAASAAAFAQPALIIAVLNGLLNNFGDLDDVSTYLLGVLDCCRE